MPRRAGLSAGRDSNELRVQLSLGSIDPTTSTERAVELLRAQPPEVVAQLYRRHKVSLLADRRARELQDPSLEPFLHALEPLVQPARRRHEAFRSVTEELDVAGRSV